MFETHVEPFVSELRHTLRQDAREREFKKFLPVCAICGKEITDERCIVLDDYAPFEYSIHKECFADEFHKMTEAKVNDLVTDWINERIGYDCDKDTPRRME